eukprot:gene20022-21982_t
MLKVSNSEPTNMERTTYNILLGIISFFSLALNSVMLLLLFKPRHRREQNRRTRVKRLLLLQLASSDMIKSTLGYGLEIINSYADLNHADAMCKASAFFVTFSGLASICHVSLLAVDICYNVCRPLSGIGVGRSVYVMPVLGWLYALIWALPPLIGWNNYTFIAQQCSLEWTAEGKAGKSYLFSLFFFCFILPVAVIITSFGCIVYRLKKKSSCQSFHQRTKSLLAKKYRSAKSSGMKMCISITTAFIIAWLPYAVVSLCVVIGGLNRVPGIALQVSGMFAKTSSITNPLVYFYTNKAFKTITTSFTRFFWSKSHAGSQRDNILRTTQQVDSTKTRDTNSNTRCTTHDTGCTTHDAGCTTHEAHQETPF